jgi:predicted TIM-barrel fold metal-dependent hydrolase
MRFIDAHHHLWDLEKHRYAWREKSATSEAAGRGTYLIGDYLADAGLYGLYRSVHVEGNFDPSDPVAETAWLQQVADTHGFPHGIVGFAALHEPNVAAVLEGHLQHRNFRGIRHILNWDPDPQLSQCDRPDYIGDRRWRAGFAFLARYGLSFDLQAHPWQMHQAAALATDYPDVQVVVDHLGMPVYRGEAGWESWRHGVQALAGCGNVTMKLSGFGMFDPAWTSESIRPEIDVVLECFGVKRCMFGSNFPVDKRWKSYRQVLEAVEAALPGLSDSEREDVLVGTAAHVYRI